MSTKVPDNVLSELINGIYEEFLKPRVTNETDFKLRADLINRIRKVLRGVEQYVPETVRAIHTDLESFPLRPKTD